MYLASNWFHIMYNNNDVRLLPFSLTLSFQQTHSEESAADDFENIVTKGEIALDGFILA